jgi:hypothetical protein
MQDFFVNPIKESQDFLVKAKILFYSAAAALPISSLASVSVSRRFAITPTTATSTQLK